jgi:hypothetical protein
MAGAKPYSLRHTLQNPLARMLPLYHYQAQAYRLGERLPPVGHMDGYGPDWEVVTMIIAPQGTQQARVGLQRDYTLISLNGSSSSNVNGGFLAQLYDVKRSVRLAVQGVQFANFGGSMGNGANTFLLREPYRFDQPDSQILVMVQNLESVQNTIQLVLYGQSLPFNQVRKHVNEFPGGPVSSTAKPPKQTTKATQ